MKKLCNVFATLVIVAGTWSPFVGTFVEAADTTFKSPTIESTPASWSNGDRAFTSNNSYATENNDGQQQGYKNFDLTVPAGATIDGIEVAIEAKQEGTTCQLQTVLSWNN
jgi:hypothetical protein